MKKLSKAEKKLRKEKAIELMQKKKFKELEDFIKRLQEHTSKNINSLQDLSGCSLHVKNITESTSIQQNNFLNFLESDLSQLISSNSNFIKPRMFVSTNRNIYNEVEKGLFREDLYYRLNVVPIKMPSLKDKFEDIPDLASHFLKKYYQTKSIKKSISHEGINLLKE